METKNSIRSFIQSITPSLEIIKTFGIITIAICCILIVVQVRIHSVYVDGGSVDVSGNVGVSGTVDVGNKVDVNLQSVLGRYVGCRRSYMIDGIEYESIDVSIR